jgi:hypothetical protein
MTRRFAYNIARAYSRTSPVQVTTKQAEEVSNFIGNSNSRQKLSTMVREDFISLIQTLIFVLVIYLKATAIIQNIRNDCSSFMEYACAIGTAFINIAEISEEHWSNVLKDNKKELSHETKDLGVVSMILLTKNQ